MGEKPSPVVFGVGELLLEDPLPTRIVYFDFALLAGFGYLVPAACPPGGTPFRQRALWCPHRRRRAVRQQPRLAMFEEGGNAGPEFVLLDFERGPTGLHPYDRP